MIDGPDGAAKLDALLSNNQGAQFENGGSLDDNNESNDASESQSLFDSSTQHQDDLHQLSGNNQNTRGESSPGVVLEAGSSTAISNEVDSANNRNEIIEEQLSRIASNLQNPPAPVLRSFPEQIVDQSSSSKASSTSRPNPPATQNFPGQVVGQSSNSAVPSTCRSNQPAPGTQTFPGQFSNSQASTTSQHTAGNTPSIPSPAIAANQNQRSPVRPQIPENLDPVSEEDEEVANILANDDIQSLPGDVGAESPVPDRVESPIIEAPRGDNGRDEEDEFDPWVQAEEEANRVDRKAVAKNLPPLPPHSLEGETKEQRELGRHPRVQWGRMKEKEVAFSVIIFILLKMNVFIK